MLYDPAPVERAKRQIVFVPIPKTAGSALIAALEGLFADDIALFDHVSQSFESLYRRHGKVDAPLSA